METRRCGVGFCWLAAVTIIIVQCGAVRASTARFGAAPAGAGAEETRVDAGLAAVEAEFEAKLAVLDEKIRKETDRMKIEVLQRDVMRIKEQEEAAVRNFNLDAVRKSGADVTDDGLANLTVYPRIGWSYPLTPRQIADTRGDYCPLPLELSCYAATYLNFSGINDGTEMAGRNEARLFVDDVYVSWINWVWWNPGPYYVANLGPTFVSGGRHTVGVILDYLDEVEEVSETDNSYFRQFVWRPYALYNDLPYETHGPKKDGTGAEYYNCDGYSFDLQPDGSTGWWMAIGVLPADSSADYDIRLWDRYDYGGSEKGFGSGYLASSGYWYENCDFVLVNGNRVPFGTYYAGVVNWNETAANYRVETAASTYLGVRPAIMWNGPYVKGVKNVIDVFEVYLEAGTNYRILLDQTAGECDLAMALYSADTTTCTRASFIAFEDAGRSGGDESMAVNITSSGWYGLAVWKANVSSFNSGTTYRIAVCSPRSADLNVDCRVDFCDFAIFASQWLEGM